MAGGSGEFTGGRDTLGHHPHGDAAVDAAAPAGGSLEPTPSPANSLLSVLFGTTQQQEPEAGLCLAASDRCEGSCWE